MSGSSDASTSPGQEPTPRRPAPVRAGARSLVRWVVVPAVLGSIAGVLVVLLPWIRHVLVFGLVVSGLAWLLRVAGDWIVERAGPTRGVVLIGTVLFGSWLIMVLNATGLGSLRTEQEPKDPYALPPAGSKGVIPRLQEPGEPIDPVQPLKDLITREPTYEPPPAATPPADGRAGTARVTLQLSSSQSTFGEGVVLIAEVAGDGRPVHGPVVFLADGKVVDQRTLRVQGASSQIEYRLAGLPVGTHALQAKYLGSRMFAAAESPVVEHRVVGR